MFAVYVRYFVLDKIRDELLCWRCSHLNLKRPIAQAVKMNEKLTLEITASRSLFESRGKRWYSADSASRNDHLRPLELECLYH